MMKLYWAPQTRSTRVLWMLEEAGCPYERVPVDLGKGEQSRPDFRAVNPMMKVPALSDGAAMVAECAAICAYIAERVPGAGLAPPLGDPARGRYLHWLFFSAGCMEQAFVQKMMKLEISPSTAGWGSFERVMDVLTEALEARPWILGEKFSAADVMLGSDLNFGMNLLKVVEPRPAFTAYVARCDARPARQRALAINAAGV
jgi:glutathione S-transferase